MSDIKLNSQGDLDISQGKLTLLPTIEESTKQRLIIKMKTYLGEWYLDLSEGIPYLQVIFRGGTPKSVIDSIFREAITEESSILRLNNFQSEISGFTYNMSFEAVTTSGETIIFTEQIEF